MGTNFYGIYKSEELKLQLFHLGKRSIGWKFSWHGFIENGRLITHKGFLETLDKIDGFYVEDEYGGTYSFKEFIELAENWDKEKKNTRSHSSDNRNGENLTYKTFC